MAIFRRKDEDSLDGYLILHRLLERETAQKMQFFAFLAVVLMALLFLYFYTEDAGIAQFAIISVLISAVLSILLLRSIIASFAPERNVLHQILQRQPRLVVWIYVINTDIAPAGIFLYRRCTLVFRLIDRREFFLFGSEREVEAAKGSLRLLLPQATFGYSAERAQWFAASPLLLWSENVPLPDVYYEEEEED